MDLSALKKNRLNLNLIMQHRQSCYGRFNCIENISVIEDFCKFCLTRNVSHEIDSFYTDMIDLSFKLMFYNRFL